MIEMGLVLIDEELCIGCKECLEVCPFGAMQYNDDQETAVKCDLCIDRLKKRSNPGLLLGLSHTLQIVESNESTYRTHRP